MGKAVVLNEAGQRCTVASDMSNCPVCDAPADDPVTLICGTLYCRKHILPLWNKQHKENAPAADRDNIHAESAFHCPITGGCTPLPRGARSLWGNIRLRHNVEQAQRRRTSTRSPSPPSSPSRAPALMPPDLSPMARSGLPSPSPAFGAIQPLVPQPGAAPGDVPVMCFRRGDAFIPVEEEYNTKRASLGTVLVRAEHHTKSLTNNMAEMVSLRDDVQAEYHGVVKDVRVRFKE